MKATTMGGGRCDEWAEDFRFPAEPHRLVRPDHADKDVATIDLHMMRALGSTKAPLPRNTSGSKISRARWPLNWAGSRRRRRRQWGGSEDAHRQQN